MHISEKEKEKKEEREGWRVRGRGSSGQSLAFSKGGNLGYLSLLSAAVIKHQG